ncbi:hypothetical protein IJM86_05235 [bacterium]|nr:hypothetical protein [bacterium]
MIQFQKSEYERKRDNVLDWIYESYANEKNPFGLLAFEIENILSQATREFYPDEYKANPDSTLEAVKQTLAERKQKRDERLDSYKKTGSQKKGKTQKNQRTIHK